jgi:hypothetical protein
VLGHDDEYCLKFNTSLNTIFKDTNPSTFWLNVIISEETAHYLKVNEIGEVIVKEGSTQDTAMLKSDFEKKEPAIWKTRYSDIEDSGDEDDEGDEGYGNNIITLKEEYVGFAERSVEVKSEINMEDDGQKESEHQKALPFDISRGAKRQAEPERSIALYGMASEPDRSNSPYRLIMNNFTLLKLIIYACSTSNNTNDNTNVYELMGGDDGDFTGLFCNLQV